MAFAVADLIDPDGGDIVQIALFHAEINNPFHRTADVVPVCQEADCGFFPAHSSGP